MKCFSYAVLVAVVGVGVAGLSETRARACSCATDEERVVLPASGLATVVPTDTAIWTLGAGSNLSDVALDGVSLAGVTLLTLAQGELKRWALAAPLEPRSQHTLTFACDFGACNTVVFSVGDGPSEPPAVPEIGTMRWTEEGGGLFGGESSCGETAFFEIKVAAPEATIVLLDVGAGGGDGPEAAELAAVPVLGSNGARASFFVGKVPCSPGVWDFDRGGVGLRVGTLGADGSFSGWSGRERAEAPGCQGGGWDGGIGGSGALVGLLAVRALRRRTA